MTRRDVLKGAVAMAGMSAARPSRVAAQADPAKLARIAIMVLNFESTLKVPGLWEGPTDTLDLFDVPQMFADRYGVHNIEIQHTHFASTETSFLRELRTRVERSQSRLSNINLEFGPMNISAASAVQRLQAIDLTREWIDHAVVLGCPRVMINQGALTIENRHDAIAALKAMVEYGASKGVFIGVETRGVGGNNRGVVRTVVPPPPPGTPTAPRGGQPAPGAPLQVLTAPPTWVLLERCSRRRAPAPTSTSVASVPRIKASCTPRFGRCCRSPSATCTSARARAGIWRPRFASRQHLATRVSIRSKSAATRARWRRAIRS